MKARLLIPLCLAGLTIGVSAKDDASLEGVVQLPPPTMERALNQRYGTNVEAPLSNSGRKYEIAMAVSSTAHFPLRTGDFLYRFESILIRNPEHRPDHALLFPPTTT